MGKGKVKVFKMISAKRASTIIFETDDVKRDELIDTLTESDAKYLLKKCLATMKTGSSVVEHEKG